jgi:hypothetical protein
MRRIGVEVHAGRATGNQGGGAFENALAQLAQFVAAALVAAAATVLCISLRVGAAAVAVRLARGALAGPSDTGLARSAQFATFAAVG